MTSASSSPPPPTLNLTSNQNSLFFVPTFLFQHIPTKIETTCPQAAASPQLKNSTIRNSPSKPRRLTLSLRGVNLNRRPAPQLAPQQLNFSQTCTILFPETRTRGTFASRLTPSVLKQIPRRIAAIEKVPAALKARRQTVQRHVDRFHGDIRRAFAAMSLVLRPSTVRTYTTTLAAMQPELQRTLAPYKTYAQKAMLTVVGKPIGATVLSPLQFATLLTDTPRTMRLALIFMWATASRAIDLQHVSTTMVQGVWKIELLCREEEDGALIAPKSDRGALRRIVKWIRPHPAFDPVPIRWPTWSEIDVFTKRAATTPHAIRRSSIQYLESLGYTSLQISALSGHSTPSGSTSNVKGVSPYLAVLPSDPGAILCATLAQALLEAIPTDLKTR